ncbi:MAG: formate--phosphoribosylaminoimidazolecarboxamide ligase family protein [Candidatus Micrarchaeota archaeon]
MGQITEKAKKLASSYKNPLIAVLGSHSALDICQGAKVHQLPNLVICQKGRDVVYSKYYKTRSTSIGSAGCVDSTLMLDKFSDIANSSIVLKLQKKEAIFIPHRSFSVYVGYDKIENEFEVPIFGNRNLLRAEERNVKKNQRYLLEKAGINIPKIFSSPSEIDTLCIIKASEAKRKWERAFFFASTPEQYEQKSKEMLEKGIITKEGLEEALIEEFVLGAPFNFNFFYSPLTGELELLGIDTRRQTNLDGWLHLPAQQQLELAKIAKVNNIEVGHIACTLRESLLQKVFEAGEKFVKICKEEYSPGLIGPFALQGAVSPAEKGEDIYVFDVSFRVPGSPGTRFTPYTEYLFGKSASVGNRISYEVKQALKLNKMDKIVT